jgi:hypothetical protein
MNEREIQNKLWYRLQSSLIVVPNFTPAQWFECDVFSVTKAGYWTEQEIKLTAGDFRADAEKERRYHRPRRDDEPGMFDMTHDDVKKHDLLASGDPRGPNQFWYVLTADVAASVIVPLWAGVKIAKEERWGFTLKVERPAPRLHREPAGAALIEQAHIACYWRYWRLRVCTNKEEAKEVTPTAKE